MWLILIFMLEESLDVQQDEDYSNHEVGEVRQERDRINRPNFVFAVNGLPNFKDRFHGGAS
jgi:hypothetical protein